MGFTQTLLTKQLSSHRYLTFSQRVHTPLSKHWAHTCTDAHTFTWESHRHPYRSMGSPRYQHFLMGDTQKPLSNDWAHTDTQHFLIGVTKTPLTNHWAHTDTHIFSWGSHRHPSLITGLTQIPTLSHGGHTDTPSQSLGSQIPTFSHGDHTDTPH